MMDFLALPYVVQVEIIKRLDLSAVKQLAKLSPEFHDFCFKMSPLVSNHVEIILKSAGFVGGRQVYKVVDVFVDNKKQNIDADETWDTTLAKLLKNQKISSNLTIKFDQTGARRRPEAKRISKFDSCDSDFVQIVSGLIPYIIPNLTLIGCSLSSRSLHQLLLLDKHISRFSSVTLVDCHLHTIHDNFINFGNLQQILIKNSNIENPKKLLNEAENLCQLNEAFELIY